MEETEEKDWTTTRVTFACVVTTTLADLGVLKKDLLAAVERQPDSKIVYQRVAPGRLMIVPEEARP